MKGRVELLNPERRVATLMSAIGEFVSFEIIGDYNVEIGDIISGSFDNVGRATWYNKTTDEKIDVFIESIYRNKKIESE